MWHLPTRQFTQPTSKCKVWGLARLVLRILETWEICILLLETPQSDLSTKALWKIISLGGRKAWKIFRRFIRWGCRSLKSYCLIMKRTFRNIIPNGNWVIAKWNYQLSPHTALIQKDKHFQYAHIALIYHQKSRQIPTSTAGKIKVHFKMLFQKRVFKSIRKVDIIPSVCSRLHIQVPAAIKYQLPDPRSWPI